VGRLQVLGEDRGTVVVNSPMTVEGTTFHLTLPTECAVVIEFVFLAGRTRLWLAGRREDRGRRLSKR
jgi:hypothetical protein